MVEPQGEIIQEEEDLEEEYLVQEEEEDLERANNKTEEYSID